VQCILGEAVSERKAAAYQGWHYNWAQPSLTDHNGAEESAYSCISFDACGGERSSLLSSNNPVSNIGGYSYHDILANQSDYEVSNPLHAVQLQIGRDDPFNDFLPCSSTLTLSRSNDASVAHATSYHILPSEAQANPTELPVYLFADSLSFHSTCEILLLHMSQWVPRCQCRCSI